MAIGWAKSFFRGHNSRVTHHKRSGPFFESFMMKLCVQFSGILILQILQWLFLFIMTPDLLMGSLQLHILLSHAHHIRHHSFHLLLILKVLSVNAHLVEFLFVYRYWHIMGILPMVNQLLFGHERGIPPLLSLIIVKGLDLLVSSCPKVRVNVVPLASMILLFHFVLNQISSLFLSVWLNGRVQIRIFLLHFAQNLLLDFATTFVMDLHSFHISDIEHVFATISGNVPNGFTKYPLVMIRRSNSVKLLVEMLSLINPLLIIICEAEAPLPTFRSSIWINFRPQISPVSPSSRHYSGLHLAESLGWRTWWNNSVFLLFLKALNLKIVSWHRIMLFVLNFRQLSLVPKGSGGQWHTRCTKSVWVQVWVDHRGIRKLMLVFLLWTQ